MAKSEIFGELTVSLKESSYPIIIGKGLLGDAEALRAHIKSGQLMVVSNKTIAPLYMEQLQKVFADRQCDKLILEDGEGFKNQASLFKIYDALVDKQHHRDTTLVALGGGVVGDITGFAAATYQRGVRFIQIPTTLLAQVDASVGGKTAINHPDAKNMIGSFYQPAAVIMDLNTLQTLPDREFRAGFAEIIKYMFLTEGDFYARVKSILQADLMSCPGDQLAEVIISCCRIKAKFVKADERELGQRALLNLGHTFAHALESYTHYERWLHGEAVAIGLYCAALLSYQLGTIDEQDLLSVDNLLGLAGLPRRIPEDINLQQLQNLMARDKKIKNNTIRFVLMKKKGGCYLEDGVREKDLQNVLQRATEGG